MLSRERAVAGLKALLADLAKYSPDQPRVPAGQSGGGQWTALGGWFGDSTVTNEDGSPRVMYHSTARDLSEFREGSHFGTQQAAHDRMGDLRGFSEHIGRDPETTSVYPVYLKIENPLELPDLADIDSTTGLPLEEARQNLRERGRSTEEEIESEVYARTWESEAALGTTLLERGIITIDEFDDGEGTGYDDSKLYRLLEAKGYDGIVYRNVVEDPGSESYIIFRPEQVKSALGNRGTFDPREKDISKYNPDQPRDPAGTPTGGRWTDGPASGGSDWKASREKARGTAERTASHASAFRPKPTLVSGAKTQRLSNRMLEALKSPAEGFTFDPRTRNKVVSGYAVGVFPKRSGEFDAKDFTEADVASWLADHRHLLRDPKLKVGGWLDSKTGKVWLDIVRVYPKEMGRELPVRMGRAKNQIAITDLDALSRGDFANAFIDTGGSGVAKSAPRWAWLLFDHDVSPKELYAGMQEAIRGEVTKYNPDQPRIPAGQPGGGRWASDGESVGYTEGDDPPVMEMGQDVWDVYRSHPSRFRKFEGKTLSEVAEQWASMKTEVGALVDLSTGRVLASVTDKDPGSVNMVALGGQWRLPAGDGSLAFVHNHPEPAGASLEDVASTFKSRVPNYVLVRSPSGRLDWHEILPGSSEVFAERENQLSTGVSFLSMFGSDRLRSMALEPDRPLHPTSPTSIKAATRAARAHVERMPRTPAKERQAWWYYTTTAFWENMAKHHPEMLTYRVHLGMDSPPWSAAVAKASGNMVRIIPPVIHEADWLRSDRGEALTFEEALAKYNPDQPRVPAGSSEGGRWTAIEGWQWGGDARGERGVRLIEHSGAGNPLGDSEGTNYPRLQVWHNGRKVAEFPTYAREEAEALGRALAERDARADSTDPDQQVLFPLPPTPEPPAVPAEVKITGSHDMVSKDILRKEAEALGAAAVAAAIERGDIHPSEGDRILVTTDSGGQSIETRVSLRDARPDSPSSTIERERSAPEGLSNPDRERDIRERIEEDFRTSAENDAFEQEDFDSQAAQGIDAHSLAREDVENAVSTARSLFEHIQPEQAAALAERLGLTGTEVFTDDEWIEDIVSGSRQHEGFLSAAEDTLDATTASSLRNALADVYSAAYRASEADSDPGRFLRDYYPDLLDERVEELRNSFYENFDWTENVDQGDMARDLASRLQDEGLRPATPDEWNAHFPREYDSHDTLWWGRDAWENAADYADYSPSSGEGRTLMRWDRLVSNTTMNASLMEVHSAYQGTGLAKALTASLLSEASALAQRGLEEVVTSAGMSMGGYAWARLGFLPRMDSDWESLGIGLMRRFDHAITGKHVDVPNVPDGLRTPQARDVLQYLVNGPKTNLRLIADLRYGDFNIGKSLLAGTGWSGSFKLNDPVSVTRAMRWAQRALGDAPQWEDLGDFFSGKKTVTKGLRRWEPPLGPDMDNTLQWNDLVKLIRRAPLTFEEALTKFNPDQPRVPAGQSGGGQWTEGGGTATADDTTEVPRNEAWSSYYGVKNGSIEPSSLSRGQLLAVARWQADEAKAQVEVNMARERYGRIPPLLMVRVKQAMDDYGRAYIEEAAAFGTAARDLSFGLSEGEHPSGSFVSHPELRTMYLNIPLAALKAGLSMDEATAVGMTHSVVRTARDIVTHEMAHVAHYDRDRTLFEGMNANWGFTGATSLYDVTIAGGVSSYARTNVLEFVAETATAMRQGRDLNPAAHRLYKKLNGPRVEER